MNKTNDSALRQKRLQALAKMAFKQTDAEDMAECVADMQRHASLSEDEARIVAAAFREKNLPNLARLSGLPEEDIQELLVPGMDAAPNTGFALTALNDEDEDAPADTEDVEDVDADDSDTDDSTELTVPTDDTDDDSEADDADIAELHIEVPADKLEAVQAAIDEVLGGDSLAGEADSDSEMEDDTDPMGGALPFSPAPTDEHSDDADEADEAKPLFASKVTTMTKEAIAKRKAERAKILAQAQARTVVAEDETKLRDAKHGQDTSWNAKGPFSYNEGAQPEGEVDYPTMTMKGSEGNSLREDNPTFPKPKVPTKNPENLQLKSSIDATSFDGEESARTGETPLEFEISFGEQKVPSSDPDRNEDFEVPTQMDLPKHKTTVASVLGPDFDLDKAEDVLYDLLVEAGVKPDQIGKLTFAQGINLYHEIRTAKASTKESADSAVTLEINAEEEEEKHEKEAKASTMERARLKTAYAVASKLARASIIEDNEVEALVNKWLNDGLTVQAMLDMGKMTLAAVQTKTERIAAAAADKLNTRTASVGISLNPSMTVPSFANTGQQELRETLAGMFTRPDLEEINDLASKRKR